MSEQRDEFVYMLNAMEHAARMDVPHKHGYGEKRATVLEYVAALRKRAEEAEADSARLHWMSTNGAWVAWNREGDMCRVFVRSDDADDFSPTPVCGWDKFFDTARAAIDAARKPTAHAP